MKKILAFSFSGVILLFLLAACSGLPFLATPENPVTPLPSPTENLTPGTPTLTIPPPPTDVPTPTLTPTITITPSLTPTPKLYEPALPGTPIIDLGFLPIALENVPQLTPAWQAMRPEVRQAVSSGDGQKLFVSTSAGLFIFDQSGKQLSHWRDVFTSAQPCQRCLAVDQAGKRFAVLTRNSGHWEVQVDDIQDNKWKVQKLSIPLDATFRGVENEGQVVLSPDSRFLAYAIGDSALRVFNLESGRQVFSGDKPLADLFFTPDSVYFIAREGRNLRLYDTNTWGEPSVLLLPAADTPFAVSPDAKTLAIAFGNRLRIYAIEGLKTQREFAQATGKSYQWELSFVDGSTLQGVNVVWNGDHSRATVTTAGWNIQSGEKLRLDSVEVDSLSPFPPAWNQPLFFEDSTNGLSVGEYNAFRFISNEMLAVNSTHAVCWLKFMTAEQNCVEDPEHVVFSTDALAYKEIVSDNRTLLQTWRGETMLDVFGDYRVRTLDRSGEWILIDVRGQAADLYGKNKKNAEESVGGALQGFTDSRTLMAYITQQKSKTYVITIIDKASGKTLTQEKEEFLYQPLLLNRAGSLLLLKRDLDKGLVIINRMDPPNYNIQEVTRLAFSAEIKLMAYSTKEDLLAFALSDGSVTVYSADFGASATFQAFDSPVTALAFSADDRYLAAASREGVKVFVVKPLPRFTATPTATP